MTEYREFHGVRTAYRHSGAGRDVVLLHGWGQKMIMMSAVEKHLSDRFSVWNLDFPGFGESDEPPYAWSVEEYMHFLEDFITENQIREPIFIGHSFGCRAAIRYAAVHHDVRKMCLTGAAGIRPPHGAAWHLRTGSYKAARWVLEKTGQGKLLEELKRKRGSEDYRNVTGVMRETFVKVVNDDVSPILKDVVCPVLLVFGENDEAAPLWMGKQMERDMPDAALVIFENDDHWAYWHQAERFNRVLDAFLKEDER